MLVVGDKEVAASTISVRLRSGEQSSQTLASFKESIRHAITGKAKDIRL